MGQHEGGPYRVNSVEGRLFACEKKLEELKGCTAKAWRECMKFRNATVFLCLLVIFWISLDLASTDKLIESLEYRLRLQESRIFMQEREMELLDRRLKQFVNHDYKIAEVVQSWTRAERSKQ